MIIAFIAIAGLLLSNKDDVVSFINKHNINWFERNLVSTQFSKFSQHKDTSVPFSDTLTSSDGKLIALKNEATTHEKHEIRTGDAMESQTPIKMLIEAPATLSTEIVITKPPIISDEITTQYAPAWKSLIDKIINSNKNELVASNSVGNVHRAWSTVSLVQQKSTTYATPTKKTTLAPVQHGSSKFDSLSDCYQSFTSVQLI